MSLEVLSADRYEVPMDDCPDHGQFARGTECPECPVQTFTDINGETVDAAWWERFWAPEAA